MKSKPTFETHETQISWGTIQDLIASFLHAAPKGTVHGEIMNIKLDYKGGYLSNDKLIPVTILVRKGV